MPWCDDCSRFWTTDAVSDGACPTCRAPLPEPGPQELGTPWHFKMMVVAVVAYLAWRAIQGVVWVVGRF